MTRSRIPDRMKMHRPQGRLNTFREVSQLLPPLAPVAGCGNIAGCRPSDHNSAADQREKPTAGRNSIDASASQTLLKAISSQTCRELGVARAVHTSIPQEGILECTHTSRQPGLSQVNNDFFLDISSVIYFHFKSLQVSDAVMSPNWHW